MGSGCDVSESRTYRSITVSSQNVLEHGVRMGDDVSSRPAGRAHNALARHQTRKWRMSQYFKGLSVSSFGHLLLIFIDLVILNLLLSQSDK